MSAYEQAPTQKPCPFCGSRKTLLSDGPLFWVTCDGCDAEGPYTRESSEKAVELWDTRATS